MKIRKTSISMLNKKPFWSHERIIANFGCDICPVCGETKSALEYLSKGEKLKGISSGIVESRAKGFFHTKTVNVDIYTCYTCNSEWESDEW